MAKVKGLRWYILALVAVGTVINYMDRNVLGILAQSRMSCISRRSSIPI